MALDTGSPGMLIFDRLANRLGISEKDDGKLLTYSAGIGGEAPSILTIIDTVQVGGAEDKFIPTVIVASLSDSFDGLIGMDFMADTQQDVRSRIVLALEASGIPIEVHHHEVATAGQAEIDMRFDTLLSMADKA